MYFCAPWYSIAFVVIFCICALAFIGYQIYKIVLQLKDYAKRRKENAKKENDNQEILKGGVNVNAKHSDGDN